MISFKKEAESNIFNCRLYRAGSLKILGSGADVAYIQMLPKNRCFHYYYMV